MSKPALIKNSSKCKIPETQLKISNFFGIKSACSKEESKLFTPSSQARTSINKAAPSSSHSTTETNNTSSHCTTETNNAIHRTSSTTNVMLCTAEVYNGNQSKNKTNEKENVPSNIICIEEEESGKKCKFEMLSDDEFNFDNTLNFSLEANSHKFEGVLIPAHNFDRVDNFHIAPNHNQSNSKISPTTPTKHLNNPLDVTSSPEICKTENKTASSRPKKSFSSRSFLCSADTLCSQPVKKLTSFKRKLQKPQNISIEFNNMLIKDPTIKTTNNTGNSTLVLKEHPHLVQGVSNTYDSGEFNLNSSTSHDKPCHNIDNAKESTSLKARLLTKSKSDNYFFNNQDAPQQSKSKLLVALEKTEEESDQAEISNLINDRLLKHLIMDDHQRENERDSSPVKVYEGHRLTMKRQAKPGLSPNRKRQPQDKFSLLKDDSAESFSAGIARRSLCLDIPEVEMCPLQEKCTILTKERAYKFGLKEKETTGNCFDKNVTLQNDKLLAELLDCMSSKQDSISKFSSTKFKKLSTKQNLTSVSNDKTYLFKETKTNFSDVEMLEKLFGPSTPEETLVTNTSPVKENNEVIVIEDSEAPLGQDHECIEVLDSIENAINVSSNSVDKQMEDDLLNSTFDISYKIDNIGDPKVNFKFTDLWQRFSVADVSHDRSKDEVILSLLSQKGQSFTCVLTGFWADTHIEKNDVVNVIGDFEDGHCVLTDSKGLLIVNPDFLLSGTLVVSSMFCARKSVLKEKFQGMEKGNNQMLYGSIIHSLFQHALKDKMTDERAIMIKAKSLLASNKFLHDMYGQGVEEAAVMQVISSYVPSLLKWLKKNVDWTKKEGKLSSEILVREIHDIEENFWSPRFGLKGKIDMTVEAALKKAGTNCEVKILPLELKTGKASFSSEHKGQVTLYSMMYSDRRHEPDEGILLYLKNGDMQLVPTKPESKSGLIQLRNDLAYYLSRQVNTDSSADHVTYSLGQLPKPINNLRSCSPCSQLINCSIYQKYVENSVPVKEGAMGTLINEVLSHLDADELDYYKFWILCLDLEMTHKNLKGIWCMSSSEREKTGDCIKNLSIIDSTLGIPDTQLFTEGKGCSLTFTREESPPLNVLGFTSGDSVVISSEDGQYIALTTGFIRAITANSVEVVVDRDYLHDTSHFQTMKFRLDRHDGLSISGYLYTNLSKLMESSAKSKRLRDLIIKKSQPQFELKLSKSLVCKVKPIFKTLNRPQKSAVLKVLMAKDYVLIRGFPGAGKTSTIVALVKILQLLGRSVLLASFTHSAVDNILLKLKEDDVRFLRLGRKGRIHPHILPYSAETLSTSCEIDSVQKLKTLYDSFDIIATSSFGINHPLFYHRKFDFCIMDEASQILQPACLGPLFYCDKFVLVGDPEQLPPVVQSKEARKLCMDESLFSKLENCGACFDLNLQYRMNRVIMALSNKLVYNGKLQCGTLEVAEQHLKICEEAIKQSHLWLREALSPMLDKSVMFLNTQFILSSEQADGKGIVNLVEADLVITILSTLVKGNVHTESIGVISPYRSQVRLLQFKVLNIPELCDVEVNTVDQYQGRDKSVIVVSFVRTKDDYTGELLKDIRRLNVAITRAKHKLLLIGNKQALKSYEHFALLISHLEDCGNILDVPQM